MKMKNINWNLVLGACLLLIVVAGCLISFCYLPYPPNVMDNVHAYLKPGMDLSHLLGTDQYGRDILSRILVGSRTVLLIGFVSVIGGALFGSVLGASAAMIKGIYGTIVMRAIEGLIAFPLTIRS